MGIDEPPALQVTVSTADQEQQQEQDRRSILMFVYCRYHAYVELCTCILYLSHNCALMLHHVAVAMFLKWS